MTSQKQQIVEFRGTLRPLYRELLENPPSGIKYHIYDPRYSMLARRVWGKTWIPGKVVRHIYWRVRYNPWLNGTLLHLSNYWDFSPIRMRRGFVVDTENVGTFVSNWKFEDLLSQKIRRTIEDGIRSKYCRKIMPLTHAAKRTMEAVFNMEGLREKVEVVYPAIRPLHIARRHSDEVIRILFIGSDFRIKGGRELIEAFRVIRKRFDVELVIVSQEAYSSMQPEENVKIFTTTPRQELLSKFFPTADIFCLPTYADSFGFVFLEAKAAGLPIVSTNHFHIPEIIEDGKTGLLIKAPLSCWKTDFTYNPDWQGMLSHHFPEAVSELAEKLSILIENTSLRQQMGELGRKEIETGKFSLQTRNKKLKEIYSEAIDRQS